MCKTELDELRLRVDAVEKAQAHTTLWAQILFHSNWSALAPLSSEPTISVVLPTQNRAQRLRRAVDSVLAQTYAAWELVVVNDGSADETESVIEGVADKRVTLTDGAGSGTAQARNVGLREASGSIVTFLDDDNLMAPGWLRAVAIAFQKRPHLNAVYGAQLRSSEAHVPDDAFLLFVSPFDWSRLVHDNFIDIGVVAHRNGLQELTFDEGLTSLCDWDYVVMLASRFGIEPLPVLASFYTTDAPMRRLLDRGAVEREIAMLRRRFRDAFGPPS